MSEVTSPHPEEHHTPSFELENVDLYRQYLLSSRMEILYILRTLQKRGCMSTVHFDNGQSFFLTWILEVSDDGNTLVLDVGADPAINEKALKSPRLIVTANLDRIKTQFRLHNLERINFEGRTAFRAALPEEILRLQRREYFRVVTSLVHPVYCLIPAHTEEGVALKMHLPLLDISGGGISLKCPLRQAGMLKTGSFCQDCRLELPEDGIVPVTLSVRSAYSHATTGHDQFMRIGAEFVSLSANHLATIQRFITRLERERKARESGIS